LCDSRASFCFSFSTHSTFPNILLYFPILRYSFSIFTFVIFSISSDNSQEISRFQKTAFWGDAKSLWHRPTFFVFSYDKF